MTEEVILAREEELRQAQLNGDVAALDRLIDDALVFTAWTVASSGRPTTWPCTGPGGCGSPGWTRPTGTSSTSDRSRS